MKWLWGRILIERLGILSIEEFGLIYSQSKRILKILTTVWDRSIKYLSVDIRFK